MIENKCKLPSCDGCRYHDDKMVLLDISGRKCMLIYYNAGGMTLAEIADLYGITRERVRQIEVVAIRKLRQKFRVDYLKEWIDAKQRARIDQIDARNVPKLLAGDQKKKRRKPKAGQDQAGVAEG